MNEENMSPVIKGEIIEEQGMSPTPKKVKEMDFPDALREVIAGKKITKLEWCNKEVIVSLENEVLVIRKDDGKLYQLIISEGDAKGEDWIVV